MRRQRVAAIIIENRKILLVRDEKADFFSMPGGSMEENEDHQSALAREIEEEIQCSILDMKYYYSFDLVNQSYQVPQTDHVYIVTIDNEPACSMEICELGWFSKEDILTKKVEVPPAFFKKLVPTLIEENML